MLLILKTKRQEELDKEMFQKIKDGVVKERSKDQMENDAALFIQRHIKGILARKNIDEIRQEEMVFLGMSRKPKTGPIAQMKKTMEIRKQKQKSYMSDYVDAKDDVKQEIIDMEEDQIKEEMLKERRDWIQEVKT
jgi:hypothetical protein